MTLVLLFLKLLRRYWRPYLTRLPSWHLSGLLSQLRRLFDLRSSKEKKVEQVHQTVESDLEKSVIVCPSSLPLPFRTASPNPLHLDAISFNTASYYSFANESGSSQDLSEIVISGFDPTPLGANGKSSDAASISRTTVDAATFVSTATIPGLSTQIDKLVAVTVDEFQRYERNIYVDRVYNSEHIINSLTTSFHGAIPPANWTPITHPEGALYFHDDKRNVLTDAYLYDHDVAKRIEDVVYRIFRHVENYNIKLPSHFDLVLEVRRNTKCGYYFVDHNERCLFWLDDIDVIDLLAEVKVDLDPSLVAHEMESQYWYHNELFPSVKEISFSTIHEIEDILIHAVGDSLTSPVFLAPYSFEILQKMLSLVGNIKGQTDTLSPGSACILYRLMKTFAHERFLNLNGQRTARLCRDQSVHGKARRDRTYIMKILSPFFLYAPDVHLKKLEEMSVDSLVNKPSWNHILAQLTDEWKEFTLYATVLLNANVAFLAIQSVDELGGSSAAHRASYFSTVNSVGAIIIGLLLARQHHTTLSMSFLAHRSVSTMGLETLALMYSLPYALLMWGMVSFLAAFSSMCYMTNDTVTYLLMSVAWFALAILLLWCISTSFENKPYFHPWPSRAWLALKGQLRTWRVKLDAQV